MGNAGLDLGALKLYRQRYKHLRVQYSQENTRISFFHRYQFMVQGAAECRAAVEMDGDLAAAEETVGNNILTFFAYFLTIITKDENAVSISCRIIYLKKEG